MTCFIIIREYKPTDFHAVHELVRGAYLSNVFTTWRNGLTREITFQLIVMSAAVLFIFFHVPLLYCFFSIPLVLGIIYVTVYTSYLFKATELMQGKKPLQCWVAEACEPFLFMQRPEDVSYRIIADIKDCKEPLDMGNFKRTIIGTVALSRHLIFENSIWLHRLAVQKSYRNKRVAHALVQASQRWGRELNYTSVEVALSECQDSARHLFVNMGFELRQMYHQQLIGSALTLLMYQLSCNLCNIKPEL
ncbi:hypothetical protein PPYR_13635 [Photinus pyralis]|uniref:N-acetyltransferase domain-containing protein n=2 Tax=Photinus pyralis TaxID=7054 RepID=A0A5N4A9L6_PHOPY|nr:uncharacterized protein LOC116178776 [Photinus pyralis]KAB0794015.1 hypothetical protein PPYR_13635 [Photinus pyralis]